MFNDKGGLAARALLLLALVFTAGTAHAARFLYTSDGHPLDSARVTGLGHTFAEFRPNDAGWAGVFSGANGAFDAIVVGEGQLYNAISANTRTAIASYVSGGGRVIVVGDHQGSTTFTNSVFGYAATAAYGCSYDESFAGALQPGAVGTSFAGGPPALANLSCTGALNLSSVPAAATTIYAGASTSLVFAADFGAGQVVYLGWDFCCGSIANEDDWYLVLDSSLAFDGFVPPFTTCAAEGFSGSKLTMCRQICEIKQSPTKLASLVKLYTAAFREQPPCEAVLSAR